jgi:hypothetical protein
MNLPKHRLVCVRTEYEDDYGKIVYSWHITIGKIYESIANVGGDGGYIMVNDINQVSAYDTEFFSDIKEHSNEKLDQILNS